MSGKPEYVATLRYEKVRRDELFAKLSYMKYKFRRELKALLGKVLKAINEGVGHVDPEDACIGKVWYVKQGNVIYVIGEVIIYDLSWLSKDDLERVERAIWGTGWRLDYWIVSFPGETTLVTIDLRKKVELKE